MVPFTATCLLSGRCKISPQGVLRLLHPPSEARKQIADLFCWLAGLCGDIQSRCRKTYSSKAIYEVRLDHRPPVTSDPGRTRTTDMSEEEGITLEVRKAQLDRREADIRRWEASNAVRIAMNRYVLPRVISYCLWLSIFAMGWLLLAIERGNDKTKCSDEFGLMSWAILIICSFGTFTTLIDWRLRDFLHRTRPFTWRFAVWVWLWYLLPPVLGIAVSMFSLVLWQLVMAED